MKNKRKYLLYAFVIALGMTFPPLIFASMANGLSLPRAFITYPFIIINFAPIAIGNALAFMFDFSSIWAMVIMSLLGGWLYFFGVRLAEWIIKKAGLKTLILILSPFIIIIILASVWMWFNSFCLC